MLDEFFNLAIGLKSIDRQGWKDKLDIDLPESVSDHCYSMTVMVMVFGDMLNLNTSKMMKMSLIHDLAESIIGDITPAMMLKDKKEALEDKTMKEILERLPNDINKEYVGLWNDYRNNLSEEAILVHEIDKLEMAFQAGIYFKKGYSKEKIQNFLDSAKKEIKDPKIQQVLRKILEECN